MKISSAKIALTSLPVRSDPKTAYGTSFVAAALMIVLSIAGLLFPSTLYPTEALLQSYLPNDVINLIIGVPILLGSMWLAQRSKLVGLLFWPGALMYILYNYVAYAFTVPSMWASVSALILLGISIYALVILIARIDGEAVQQRLIGTVSEKLSAGMLFVFGLAFVLRAADIVFKARASQTTLPATEWGVLVSDVLLSTAWIIGGVSLWRRKALGYVSGAGLLFVGSMLFIGLILYLLLQPFLTSAPFILSDVIVVSIMGLVCSIPSALFVRGVLSNKA